MKHELPKLDYLYDALEPWIDAKTMEIHYSKHHQAYADKMNAVLEKYPDLAKKDPIELMKNLSNLPMDEKDKNAFKNNGGGYVNHSLFWKIMGPNAGGEPIGVLGETIKNTFGGFNKFKEEFGKSALGIFGSGWSWLVINQDKKLEIISTPNQDSPLMEGNIPIFCIDIWEHAFYLLRQNRKNEYIDAFWNVANWKKVDEILSSVI